MLGGITMSHANLDNRPAAFDRAERQAAGRRQQLLRGPPRQPPRLLRSAESRRRRCGYTQRWQAETVNSMIKRNLGSALRGHTRQSRERDLRLKVLTHNVMIIRRRREGRDRSRTGMLCLDPRILPGARFRRIR